MNRGVKTLDAFLSALKKLLSASFVGFARERRLLNLTVHILLHKLRLVMQCALLHQLGADRLTVQLAVVNAPSFVLE